VKIRFSFIAALAVLFTMISWGSLSHAQQTTPDTQQPSQQTQQPPDTQAPPPSQTPESGQQNQAPAQPQASQAPDQSAQSDASGTKEYVGTVVKQGNKYVFQDAATGTTYDIDHQDEVKKFEGKKVRVHGTMDSSGKMIHVQ
jgi:hypothetical protein